MSIAVQRFDCMLKVLVGVVLEIRALLWFLCRLSVDGDSWAGDLLEFLMGGPDGRPRNALLAALVAEFVQSAHRFLHRSENDAAQHHIIRSARDFKSTKKELEVLFEGVDGGSPLVLKRTYTAGYVSLMREAMQFEETRAVVGGGALLFYQEGAKDDAVMEWVASAMGNILNIKKVLLAELGSEYDTSVVSALEPSLGRKVFVSFSFFGWNEIFLLV